MRRKQGIVIASLAGLLAGPAILAVDGSTLAQAGENQGKEKQVHSESAKDAQKRLTKERQVSGKVLDTKTVKFKGTDQQNLAALIRTSKNDRRLIVDLGPKSELKGINIKKGQKLSAKGAVVNIGDQQVLLANAVTRGDNTVQIDRSAQLNKLRQKYKGSGGMMQNEGMQQEGEQNQ